MNKLEVIGYACDLAANIAGAAKGPRILQHSPYLKAFQLKWSALLKTTGTERQMNALESIRTLCQQLAVLTKQSTLEQHQFLILGGDHSCAMGTWGGAAKAITGDLGLLWVDAHLDSHTPKTSLTNNIHGMPLAALLGYGDKRLTSMVSQYPALSPENVVLLGARSFESGELNLLKKLNVRIYFMEDIEKRGLHQVMPEALARITKKTDGFGISIDIDAFDPSEVPAVNTPEKNGLSVDAFLESLHSVVNNSHFIGTEIVEFNPNNDLDHRSEKVIAKLIKTLFKL